MHAQRDGIMSGLVEMAQQFEQHRHHLQAVAYRLLGSISEAEDAVQETWLRLNRSDRSNVDNLGGWLTTVISRVCLDMLRSRKAKREEPLEIHAQKTLATMDDHSNPEHEALLADSVGIALMVVLNKLNPVERVAFVLHDIFAVPYAEIARVVGKSEQATRQLASRARRKVRAARTVPNGDLARQRELVDAFLTAAYAGDFDALIKALDPDVVLRDDRAGFPSVTRGAEAIAKQVSGRARTAQTALVNGSIGVIAAELGKVHYVIKYTLKEDKIVAIELISNPERISKLDLAITDSMFE